MLYVAINKLEKLFHASAVVLHKPDDKSQLAYLDHIRSKIHSYTTFDFLDLIRNSGCKNFLCHKLHKFVAYSRRKIGRLTFTRITKSANAIG